MGLKSHGSLLGLIRLCGICLPLIPVPDAVERFDIGEILVIADTDKPGEPQGKPAFVIGAGLQFGIAHFKDQ